MKSCYNSCVSRIENSIYPVDGYSIIHFSFSLEKKDSNINVIANGRTYNSFGEENQNGNGALFDLRNAEFIDSLVIDNQIIYDVYKYNTSEIILRTGIEAMYWKKGLGIIKIAFANNLNFELTNFTTLNQ